MLKAICNVGYISNNMAKHDLGMADRRMANFCSNRYIEKLSFYDSKTRQTSDVYRLTEKGQKLCKRELGVEYFYKSSSPRHDLALAKKYFEIGYEERQTWKTESELLRHMFRDRMDELYSRGRYDLYEQYEEKLNNREISPTDGAYVCQTSEGEVVVCVEIITGAYGHQEICSKENFVEVMCTEKEFIRI